MSRNRPRTHEPTRYLQQAAIGVAGGLLGALAMNGYARLVSAETGGHEADGAAPGRDRAGRGMQPPQATGSAEEDATVQVGRIAYRAVTGERPRRVMDSWLGSAAHYAFSAWAGACYGLMAEALPRVRTGFGTLYGTAVWAVADECVTPALGLSRPPADLSIGMHAYSLAGHWVYGATLESARRTFRADRR